MGLEKLGTRLNMISSEENAQVRWIHKKWEKTISSRQRVRQVAEKRCRKRAKEREVEKAPSPFGSSRLAQTKIN